MGIKKQLLILFFLFCLFSIPFFFREKVVPQKLGNFEALGPAIESVSTFEGVFVERNGEVYYYGVTGSGEYGRLFRFNTSSNKVDLVVPIKDAKGSRTMELIGDSLYIGTYWPASLYRFDLLTNSLEKIATLEGESYIWDIKIKNEKVFLGTYPNSKVYIYEIQSGNVIDLGSLSEEKYVRSLEVTDDKIYAGIGARAELIEYEIKTGKTRNILPLDYSDNSFVRDLKLIDSRLFIALSPFYDILVYDLEKDSFNLLLKNSLEEVGDRPIFSQGTDILKLSYYIFEYNETKNSLTKIFLPDNLIFTDYYLSKERGLFAGVD